MCSYILLCKPKQWIKNIFVLAPFFFTHILWSLSLLGRVLIGFACFCFIASSIYILNDYKDREADRLHPVKSRRPIASGAVDTKLALLLAVFLVLLGVGLASYLSVSFCKVLLIYLSLNIAYCFGMKSYSIIDVMSIALGFVLRVEAGATLVHSVASVWIIICTGLLALFIAFAKRRDDVVTAMSHAHRQSLAGYNLRFIDACMMVLTAALIIAYVIYTTDASVMSHFHSKHVYYTVPFVLAGVFRYLQITLVEETSASPTDLLLTDTFLQISIFGWIAMFGCIMIWGF